MATRKTTQKRKISRKKKQPGSLNFLRLLWFVVLLLFLGISVCSVGYVIFFRAVFAQEILPTIKDSIVFEEPDTPVEEIYPDDHTHTDQSSLPKVAIVIDDLGYNEQLGSRFVAFPLELTCSFLPFATFTGKLEEMAFKSGKTVILHLPLEPKSKKWNPGPGTMYLADSLSERAEKFHRNLLEVPHAVGINNHMGSLFTSDQQAMLHLMGLIQERELFFLDSFTTSNSMGLLAAKESGIKVARRNVFLDNKLSVDEICKQIDKLVVMAERKGRAVGIGHPHSETLDALSACTPPYKDRIDFVSVTEVLQ